MMLPVKLNNVGVMFLLIYTSLFAIGLLFEVVEMRVKWRWSCDFPYNK